ncbi:hypothetical protein AVEN_41385-1 [Araneus ventricosus]|uniref:Uncharacterized protein n=1 Tax=Araneus ventricosus TaxID=182803 RepID=A0A4Y2SJB1_ARAVE|nr:hypothetical protein AVEN_41385-1 [Araneus ventricosus]
MCAAICDVFTFRVSSTGVGATAEITEDRLKAGSLQVAAREDSYYIEQASAYFTRLCLRGAFDPANQTSTVSPVHAEKGRPLILLGKGCCVPVHQLRCKGDRNLLGKRGCFILPCSPVMLQEETLNPTRQPGCYLPISSVMLQRGNNPA